MTIQELKQVIFDEVRLLMRTYGGARTATCRHTRNNALMYTRGRQTVNNNIKFLGYNAIGLYDTSPITSHFLWYHFIPNCEQ